MRQVSCVSSNSTPVSSVKKRASGSIRTSMSMITEASFWNEHATNMRGWKRSTPKARTSSAEASSRSSGTATAMACLNRALALAALDAVGVASVPVDEVLEVLEVELHGQRQLLRCVRERLRADAVDERVERLAVLALALVQADPALDRLGHALGGQPDLHALAVGELAALVAAADVGDVGGDLAVADP